MAQQDLHLRRRHNAYFFRRRLPSPIASAVGRSEINMSLKTGQLSLARQRAARFRVACDMAIEGFLMGRFLRTDKFDAVVWDYYNIVSKAVEDIRIGVGLHEPGAVDQYFLDESLKADAALGLRDISFISPDARAGLAARGLELDPGSDEFQALALDMALARRRVEAKHYGPGPQNPRQALTDEEFAALERRFAPRPAVTTEKPVEAQRPVRPALAEIVETYLRDVEISGKIEEKTLGERRRDIGLFAEFAGANATIDELNRGRVRDFRNLLMRLPPRFRLAKDSHERSLDELAEANSGGETLSPASINKILSNLSVFMDRAVVEWRIEAVTITDLKLDDTLAIDEDRRAPFAPDQLKAIFEAPYFVGCQSEDEWWKPGQVSMRGTGRYWMILMGLLTGARAEELAGLIREDIDLSRGLIRIAPNPHRRRLKNAVSKRWVPIHPLLMQLGFGAFVASSPGEPGDRLFSDIVSGEKKPHSASFSKFFGRFLDRLGLNDRKLVFHSFRSTFVTRAEAALVPDDILDRLVGHARPHSDSRKHYRGKDAPDPDTFAPFEAAILQIDFGVDLSHLRADHPALASSHLPIATEKLHPFEVSNQ